MEDALLRRPWETERGLASFLPSGVLFDGCFDMAAIKVLIAEWLDC
jgi:hypothetical protein